MERHCDILLDDSSKIKDLILNGPPVGIADNAIFRFLSVVDTARIPLYLAVGSPCSVLTPNSTTERWFRDLLLNTEPDEIDCTGPHWWDGARRDSPLGILVSVSESVQNYKPVGPLVTELLFYASRAPGLPTPPPSSPYQNDAIPHDSGSKVLLNVHALALSSDLIRQDNRAEPTPPTSPVIEDAPINAVFLPELFPVVHDVINQPPVRKRKSATDVFDEANERRKKARREGGEGVSAAAATKNDSQVPTLQHRRSNSNSQPVPLQTRPLSRSPSVASSRPTTAIARRSTLSRVQSATVVSDIADIETKNKDVISRIVMAGMRLYGLSQSKSRKSRGSSSAPSPVVDAGFEELEAERKNDEEFKLIYHQAFKGTCFAFRATISEKNLQPVSNVIRDVADKLLGMFCKDPFVNEHDNGMKHDAFTPGGRKAFGSSAQQN